MNDRIFFAQIAYQIVIEECADAPCRDLWSGVFVKLTKSKHNIDHRRLVIDWRPLYALVKRTYFVATRDWILPGEQKYIAYVVNNIKYMNKYFSANAVDEIMDEVRELFYPMSISVMSKALCILYAFLPTRNPQVEKYIPEILTWMNMVQHHDAWNDVKICFSCLLVFHRFDSFDWSLYILPFFSMIPKIIGLINEGHKPGMEDEFSFQCAAFVPSKQQVLMSLAKLIVYLILPKNNVLQLLKHLFIAIKPVCHPSNTSSITGSISLFAQSLCKYFCKRWEKEQKKSPNPIHLTMEMKAEFVAIMKAPLSLLMFAKSGAAVENSHSALKFLAFLNPSILDDIVDSFTLSLTAFSEHHRTISCIQALAAVLPIMVDIQLYPKGNTILLSSLVPLLAGIDSNDLSKTFATFTLLSSYFLYMPIRNQCTILDHRELTEEEQLAKDSTEIFDEWVPLFNEKIMSIIKNISEFSDLSPEESTESAKTDRSTVLIQFCCLAVYSQMSLEYHKKSILTWKEFILHECWPQGEKLFGMVVQTLKGQRPALVMNICGNEICTALNTEIERSESVPSERCRWLLTALASISHESGTSVVPHVPRIMSILQSLLTNTKDNATVHRCVKIMKNIVKSMIVVYPLNAYSSNLGCDDVVVSCESIAEKENLCICWNTCDSEKEAFSADLIQSILRPALTAVTTSIDKDVIWKNLQVIAGLSKCVVVGLSQSVENINRVPATDPSYNGRLKAYATGTFSVNFQNFLQEKLREITRALSVLSEKFSKSDVTSTRCMTAVIEIIQILTTNRGASRYLCDSAFKTGRSLKIQLRRGVILKELPRFVRVHRVYLLHLFRIRKLSGSYPDNDCTQELNDILLQLCFNPYVEVRKQAQTGLSKCLVGKLRQRQYIFSLLIGKIAEPNLPKHVIKGCVYTLALRHFLSMCARDFNAFGALIRNIIHVQGFQKNTLQENIFQTFTEIRRAFVFIPIKVWASEKLCSLCRLNNILSNSEPIGNPCTHDNAPILQRDFDFIVATVKNASVHHKYKTFLYQAIGNFLGRDRQILTPDLAILLLKAAISDITAHRMVSFYLLEAVIFLRKSKIQESKDQKKVCLKFYKFWPQNIINVHAVDFKDAELRGAIIASIDLKETTSKLFKYSIMDSSGDSDSNLNCRYVYTSFYKSLFITGGPSIWASMRECLGEPLPPNITEKVYARGCLEVIGGLLRAARKWTASEQQQLWPSLQPLFEKFIYHAILETGPLLFQMIRYVYYNNDLIFLKPLTEIILRWNPENSQTAIYSISIMSKMALFSSTKGMLMQLAMPFVSADHPLFSSRTSPYQLIRRDYASFMSALGTFSWSPLDKYADIRQNFKSLMLQFIPSSEHIDESQKTVYLNGCKSFCVLTCSVLAPFVVAMYEEYAAILLPGLLNMKTFDDQQLPTLLAGTIAWLASRNLKNVGGQLIKICCDHILKVELSYQIRQRGFDFLGMFFPSNYYFVSEADRKMMQDTMDKCLVDFNVEVRLMAAIGLSVLTTCLPEIVPGIVLQYSQVLSECKLRDENPTHISIRHGAILALSKAVETSPYDVPEWMPQVLVVLSRFVTDRNPIAGTIRKLFSEFKRTHQDNWHIDRLKFTVEELDAVTELLIAPSYYA